jgi:arylsulfatase A-like enzyme
MTQLSFARHAARPWLLLAVCLLAACKQPGASNPNVVVVVIDTLRADRLGVLGNTRGLTPFLDSLADRSVVFHRAYAASCWTQPSVASLFTSRFQSQHGIVSPASKLDPSEVTLAEVLQEHGYSTAAFSANGLIAAIHGYGQGFDTYKALFGKQSPRNAKRLVKYRAEEINAMARAWLDQLPAAGNKPFFLYLQYLEPHTPYAAPDEMLRRTFGDRPHPDLEKITLEMQFGNWAAPDPPTLRDIVDAYDAEVASADAGVRELYAILQERHLLDNTVVVVTADHGEGLLDHGLLGHGGTLYEEVIHVPLLVVPPGGVARLDVQRPVSLLDVAPTLLDVAGIAAPPPFEGHSLGPVLWQAEHPWRARVRAPWAHEAKPLPVFSEHIVPADSADQRIRPHERAIIVEQAKLIVGVNGERESYDLAADPGEHTPLLEAEATRLGDVLVAFRESVAKPTQATPAIDPELRARLRALGYFN